MNKQVVVKTILSIDASTFDFEIEKFYNLYIESGYDVQVQYKPVVKSTGLMFTALLIARKGSDIDAKE